MDQLQEIFRGHKTVAALLADAGYHPAQIRQGRPFASQWAWSDGAMTVASVWLDEVQDSDGDLQVEFADPSARTDLVGLRRSRATQRYDLLSAAQDTNVRAIVQQRAKTVQGTPSEAQKRALDPAAWEVRSEPGKVVLRRLEAPLGDQTEQHVKPWTDEELNAAVIAYLDIQSQVSNGLPVNRAQRYRQLGSKFGRPPGEFERRMQNISYLLALKGRAWTPGLAPLSNVGAKTAAKIEEILGARETTLAGQGATFEVRVAEAYKKLRSKPAGSQSPGVVHAVSLQFVRDPEVKAWVLRLANGICECCGQPAPFNSVNGPFLEVHHVQRLADKGADTVENSVAICPNCHRRLHYGVDAATVVDLLYARIERLSRDQKPVGEDDGIVTLESLS